MNRLLQCIVGLLISLPALAQVSDRAPPATNYTVLYLILIFVALIVVLQVVFKLMNRGKNREDGKSGNV
jgi:hypothetical protein